MFPVSRINAKKFIKKDLKDIKVIEGKYSPKYEPSRELICENEFLKLFSTKLNKVNKRDEHEIINEFVTGDPKWYFQKPPYHCFLLFIHWYERKYKKNITNKNILINLNDFSQFFPSNNNENKITKLYTQNEVLEIVSSNIEGAFKSEIYKGYSLYYEVLSGLFPNIENFSFYELLGEKFLRYLLELFPNISGISTTKLHYIRYSYEHINDTKQALNINEGISYLNKYNIPSFLPKSTDKFSSPIRNIENILRTTKGLPKLGEGWITETTLYYEIKNALPNFEVTHHGKPDWLGRQHYDIWIPDLNCAIEYQGEQHDKPVDYFGGESAFRQNQERDILKKKKSELNNVVLIEVRPGYDIKDILQKINSLSDK